MFKLWRRLVVWLRGILWVLYVKKQPIDWDDKGQELAKIVIDAIDRDKPIPEYSIVPDSPDPGPKLRRRRRNDKSRN
jgi:hypothetical protein